MRETILKSLYLFMNSLKQFQCFNKDSTSPLALFLPSCYLPNLSKRVWIYWQLGDGSLILSTAVCSALIAKNPVEKPQDEMGPQKFLGIFLELSYRGCLYIFEISCLSVSSFAIIFSHSEGCLFTLLIVSFVVQKLNKQCWENWSTTCKRMKRALSNTIHKNKLKMD